MSKVLDWTLRAAAAILFTNAVMVVYKPVMQHNMTTQPMVIPTGALNGGKGGFGETVNCATGENFTKVVSRLQQVNYSEITTAMPHLDPSYRTSTLTRLGADLNLDRHRTSCPPDSLWSRHQITDKTPLHLDCPTLFIVGARKGGTTSLYQYLSKHPDFEGARLDKGPGAGETFHFSARYDTESWEVYLSKFPSNGVMTGDASVGNLVRCEVPRRLFESCGKQAKVVVLLRNPIDRFVSNFLLRVRTGRKHLHHSSALQTSLKVHLEKFFSEVLSRNVDVTRMPEQWTKLLCLFGPSSNMIFEGLYYVHLSNWLCNFPAENLLILNSEEFYRNTTVILRQVLEFLGLKPLSHETLTWITSTVYNKGNYTIPAYQKLTERDRKLLKNIYDPFNNALMELLDWDHRKVLW